MNWKEEERVRRREEGLKRRGKKAWLGTRAVRSKGADRRDFLWEGGGCWFPQPYTTNKHAHIHEMQLNIRGHGLRIYLQHQTGGGVLLVPTTTHRKQTHTHT